MVSLCVGLAALSVGFYVSWAVDPETELPRWLRFLVGGFPVLVTWDGLHLLHGQLGGLS